MGILHDARVTISVGAVLTIAGLAFVIALILGVIIGLAVV